MEHSNSYSGCIDTCANDMHIYNENNCALNIDDLTCKFGSYSWTKAQLEPFGINEI